MIADYRQPPPAPEADTAAPDDAKTAPEEAEVEPFEVETRSAEVAAAQHGERLDKLLVAIAPEFSRNYLQQLIAESRVRVDGAIAHSASARVRAGQRIAVELRPTPQSMAFHPEPMALAIVDEDEHLLVIDKPAGLVVHPAAGHWSGTLLNGLLAHHQGAAALPRAGIVHRLDKDTSGLMVVAKTLQAATALVRSIAAREVRREYLAIAHGAVAFAEARIDAPIGRDPRSRVRMAVVASGRPAATDVARVAVGAGCSALRCRLHTGRTHQIRVHLASRGHPLVGDALYGGRPLLGVDRQALHAVRLGFGHPASGRTCVYEVAPPADFAAAWRLVHDGV